MKGSFIWPGKVAQQGDIPEASGRNGGDKLDGVKTAYLKSAQQSPMAARIHYDTLCRPMWTCHVSDLNRPLPGSCPCPGCRP